MINMGKIKTEEHLPKNLIDQVKEILAAHIGVEPEDIHEEDLLAEDLHMSAYDISDFLTLLGENGFEIKEIELTKIETVSDIVEALSSTDLIN